MAIGDEEGEALLGCKREQTLSGNNHYSHLLLFQSDE